jgi:hypothetical protein
MEKQKDGTCVTYEGEYDVEMRTGLWRGNLRERDHLQNIGIDGGGGGGYIKIAFK